jgi:hypothetical protein
VHWDNLDNYPIASFIFHDHATIAYFSEDGELLGSARTILFNQFPLAVIKSFEEKFSGGDFTETTEILTVTELFTQQQ